MTRLKRAMTWARDNLGKRGTLLPIGLIVLLVLAMVAHQVTKDWDRWTAGERWATKLARTIPDEADAAILINTAGLRNTERRNTVNAWRRAATNSGAPDVTEWLNGYRGIGDEMIQDRRVMGLVWMRFADSETEAATMVTRRLGEGKRTEEKAPESGWTEWPTRYGLAAVESIEDVGRVTRADETKSLATTADFQQAEGAIESANTAVTFARWRSLPETLKESIGLPLNCDLEKWIAVGVDVEGSNDITVTVACPHPPGQWGAGALESATTDADEWDAVIGTTFTTEWGRLDAGNAGTAIAWATLGTRTRDPETARGILESLTGEAWLGYREREGKQEWSLTLPILPGKESEAAEGLANLSSRPTPNDNRRSDSAQGRTELTHPGFPDDPIRIETKAGAVVIGTGPAVTTEPAEGPWRTRGEWNGKAMMEWGKTVWPAAVPWLWSAERVEMTGQVTGGVNIYEARVEIRESPTPSWRGRHGR